MNADANVNVCESDWRMVDNVSFEYSDESSGDSASGYNR